MSNLSFYDLVTLVKASPRKLLVVTLVVMVVAGLIAFFQAPVYRSEAVLIQADKEQSPSLAGLGASLGGLAALTGISLGNQTSLDEALATLQSRVFIESFLVEKNLLPILFSSSWDEAAGIWKDVDDQPSLHDGYKRLIDSVISVRQTRSSTIVTLRVEWTDPVIAADWCNQLIARLNNFLRLRAIDDAQKSITYLKKELEATNILGIDLAINRLIEEHITKIMLANVREQFMFHVIDPAAPSDPDDWVRPQRALLLGISIPFGLLLGFLVILVAALRKNTGSSMPEDG